MKVLQSYRRNAPSSAGGYSLTVTIVYTSPNPKEIDEIEKKLPKGTIILDVSKPYPLSL